MNSFDLSELTTSNVLLLIIDLQTSILSKITNKQDILENTTFMIQCIKKLNIPIILTEQYPKGLGETEIDLKNLIRDKVEIISKIEFNCFQNAEFNQLINEYKEKRPNIIISGIESHICVLQTVLGAIKAGFEPIVVKDTIASRHHSDLEAMLNYLYSKQITVLTSEMLIYLLLKNAGTSMFKALLPLLKER